MPSLEFGRWFGGKPKLVGQPQIPEQTSPEHRAQLIERFSELVQQKSEPKLIRVVNRRVLRRSEVTIKEERLGEFIPHDESNLRVVNDRIITQIAGVDGPLAFAYPQNWISYNSFQGNGRIHLPTVRLTTRHDTHGVSAGIALRENPGLTLTVLSVKDGEALIESRRFDPNPRRSFAARVLNKSYEGTILRQGQATNAEIAAYNALLSNEGWKSRPR